MTVPFLDLSRIYTSHRQEYLSAVDKVYSSGHMFGGAPVELLETNIRKKIGRQYGVAVNSCTDALYFACLATGLESGDEVIIPAFSFIATLSAVLRCGATPVFADVKPDTLMICPDSVLSCITKKTKVIMPVQLFGQTLSDCRLTDIKEQYNLTIIEDNAQGFGSIQNSQIAGSLGDISCLSFDPMKTLGSFGPGGMVLTDNKKYYEHVKSLKKHGKANNNFEYLGYNSDMPTAEAAMLNVRLKYFQEELTLRENIAYKYINAFGQKYPPIGDRYGHTWHKFVIRTSFRESLRQQLTKAGVETRIHYPETLYQTKFFNGDFVACPIAEQATREVLSLPIFAYMTNDEVNNVINTVNSCCL